jgi:ABC-type Fe3+/spermidine/putrescine transport system ATPase subunit
LRPASLRLDRLCHRFGQALAVDGISLDVEPGEFLTLLGPSGCGKTTTMRIVAGFEHAQSGRVVIDGQDVTRTPPGKREVGMVFQNYALFPHLTVAANIAFGLKQRGAPSAVRSARVAELLELIQLSPMGDRYPAQLSGGQRQRVAIARAIAHPPRILLMDEPLGALDQKLREAMQLEIRTLQRKLGITTVYVTHDQNEALTMSDRIVVMRDGRIEQAATPHDIYHRPANRFVASFVGRINLLPTRHAAAVIPRPPAIDTIGIRPEALRILPPGQAVIGYATVNGTLVDRIFAGNFTSLAVDVGEGLSLNVEIGPGEPIPPMGAPIRLVWDPAHSIVLHGD